MLKTHPAIEDAVVLAREDRVGERNLVGYIVTSERTTMKEWRAYLQKKIPSYMIPSIVIRLKHFP